jgi:hypothetical protein
LNTKKIESLLAKALLKNGKMAYSLYEYELEENREYWLNSLVQDRDDCIITITEHSGDVAMALLHKVDGLYINEHARKKLKELWLDHYEDNIKNMIPLWAAELSSGSIPLIGMKFIPNK